jgi:hypothetical protein
MEAPKHPKFEDIVNLPDPEFQLRIARASDLIIAAALKDASSAVREKILSNLSTRRKELIAESVKEWGKIPPRTVLVAKRVITKLIFGIEDEETKKAISAKGIGSLEDVRKKDHKPISRREYENFIKKMAEENPDFIQARKVKRAIRDALYIKRMLRPPKEDL